MRNREKGFTLIELLVIIIILSILIMMSTPRFSTTYSSMKIRSEALKLGGYLRFIRNKAVQNKATGVINYYDDDGQTVILTHTPTDGASEITRTLS